MQGGNTVELSEALAMLEELKLMIENMDQKRSQLSPAAGRGMQGYIHPYPFPYTFTWPPPPMGNVTECSCKILANMNAVKLSLSPW